MLKTDKHIMHYKVVHPSSAVQDYGVQLLSVRDNRPLKYGDYHVLRDNIVIKDNNIIINGCEYDCTLELFAELSEAHKKRTHDSVENKLKIWVWELSGHIKAIGNLLNHPIARHVERSTRYGLHYIVLDNMILVNYRYIIARNMNIVNLRERYEDGLTDLQVLSRYVEDFSKGRRYNNPRTETYASKITNDLYSLMSDALRTTLRNDIYNNQRCPHSETVRELIMGHKAGINYHADGIEEQLLTDVYAYDASSYYTSQLFDNRYPIGPLVRYNYDQTHLQLCIQKGWWFMVHGVSKEWITWPMMVYGGHTKTTCTGNKKTINGWKDENGYYHYTVVPYDYLALLEGFDINIFADPRIQWTSLNVCRQTGKLHPDFLSFMMQGYELKENAKTKAECIDTKNALNLLLGKSYPTYLGDCNRHARWYTLAEHYMCPQFGLHMISKARYDTIMLAKKLGFDKIDAIVTDSIKSRDSKLQWIIATHNTAVKANMASYGYENSTIGNWKDESAKYMIYFVTNTYVIENKSGEFIKRLSGICEEGANTINSMADILESDYIKDGWKGNTDGEFVWKDRKIWKNTGSRLKAKEIYYEMEKSDQGVQTEQEQNNG